MKMPYFHRAFPRVILLCITTVLVCAGCTATSQSSNAQGTDDGPWAAEIQNARDKAKGTPHEESTLKILEDGQVSEAEELELQSKVTKCMHEAGITSFKYDPEGGYGTDYDPNDPQGESVVTAERNCDAKIGHIDLQILYANMKEDPDNVGQSTLIAQCFVNKGIVDPSYSAEDYERGMTKFGNEQVGPDGAAQSDFEDFLPYIVDKEKGKPLATECLMNPNQFQSGH